MTTEVLRNMIYGRSPALADLGFVVLDEVHFLQDTYRGPVWEEVIIHLPPAVRLVCLSATVSNAEELAEWITTVRGPTAAVIEERRPVEPREPLPGRRPHGRAAAPAADAGRRPAEPGGRTASTARRVRGFRGHRRRRRRRRSCTRRRRLEVRRPARRGRDAARRSTSSSAATAATRRPRSLTRRRRAPHDRPTSGTASGRSSTATSARIDDRDLAVLGYGRFLAGLEAGVAAHHAGMVPPFKEAVEACFVEGLVKVVFATETLAVGINMPARTVVIEKLSKFTGDHHEFLTPGEYTQLTGRAGRRGIDDVGYAVVLWSPFVPFDQVAGAGLQPLVPLSSAFRPTYNMAANLVRTLHAGRGPPPAQPARSPSTRPTATWCGSRPGSSAREAAPRRAARAGRQPLRRPRRVPPAAARGTPAGHAGRTTDAAIDVALIASAPGRHHLRRTAGRLVGRVAVLSTRPPQGSA